MGIRVISSEAPEVQGDYHEMSWKNGQPDWYHNLTNYYGAQDTYNVSTRPWFLGPSGLHMIFVESQNAWCLMDEERNVLYRNWGNTNYPPFKKWQRYDYFNYDISGRNMRPQPSRVFLRRVYKGSKYDL